MNTAALRQWYESREPREQRILLIGGVLAVLILLAGVLLPLNRSVAAAASRVERKQADLTFLRDVGPRLASAGPAPVVPQNVESLVVLVDRSARESGLGQSLTGSQPNGEGRLRVEFQKADFNAWVAWLARLVNQHGLRVEAATTEATAEPGVVNATVIVRLRS
ncbi:MAG: type II secretion system protein M [Steroidobacteraceae bacterium]